MKTLTRTEMLEALCDSTNEAVAETARWLLQCHDKGDFNAINSYHQSCGSFMRSVLDDDFKIAINRADAFNLKAFLTYALNKYKP